MVLKMCFFSSPKAKRIPYSEYLRKPPSNPVFHNTTDIAIISEGNNVIQASPEKLLKLVEGKVFETIISSSELNEFRKKYLISSTIRKSSGLSVKTIGNAPDCAKQIEATLEEAYIYQMHQHRKQMEN